MDASAIKALMWSAAGLFRTRDRLLAAVDALEGARRAAHLAASRGAGHDADAWRLRNLATVSLLVARAALRREESRGGHFRADFPARDDVQLKVHLVEQHDEMPAGTAGMESARPRRAN
ncbi:MAG: hypothetical protein QM736_21340 [Vicinamibacterales bacterium]